MEHRKFFPECPIVRSHLQFDNNIDIGSFHAGIQAVRTPKYPEFSTIESRNRTFSTWTSSVQDAKVLAQAGFYYLGSGDEVISDTFFKIIKL